MKQKRVSVSAIDRFPSLFLSSY